jgi:hypothetical protein
MGKGPIQVLTLVERESRLLRVVKRPGMKAIPGRLVLSKDLAQASATQRLTLTWAKGIEMADRQELTKLTGNWRTSATHEALAGAGQTRTPTASCAGIFRNSTTYRLTAKLISTKSLPDSTIAPARDSDGKPSPKSVLKPKWSHDRLYSPSVPNRPAPLPF